MGVASNRRKRDNRAAAGCEVSIFPAAVAHQPPWKLVGMSNGIASLLLNMLPLGLLLASGCREAESVTLSSPDGQTRITVSDGMTPTDALNEDASIQAANDYRRLFLAVTTTPKSSLPPGATLVDYHEGMLQDMTGILTDASVSGNKVLKVNGLDALQTSIVANLPGEPEQLAYLVSAVESAQSFHQVLLWTTAASFEKNRPLLTKITDTFQCNDGPASSAVTGVATPSPAAPAASSTSPAMP